MNITDINNLIYAAATIITQILNEPRKREKIEILSFGKKNAETDQQLEKRFINNS